MSIVKGEPIFFDVQIMLTSIELSEEFEPAHEIMVLIA